MSGELVRQVNLCVRLTYALGELVGPVNLWVR